MRNLLLEQYKHSYFCGSAFLNSVHGGDFSNPSNADLFLLQRGFIFASLLILHTRGDIIEVLSIFFIGVRYENHEHFKEGVPYSFL